MRLQEKATQVRTRPPRRPLTKKKTIARLNLLIGRFLRLSVLVIRVISRTNRTRLESRVIVKIKIQGIIQKETRIPILMKTLRRKKNLRGMMHLTKVKRMVKVDSRKRLCLRLNQNPQLRK